MSRRIGRGFFLISALVAAVPVNHGRAAEPSVEAGFYVSYALTRDGRLYAWGANFHGQLANGTFTTNNPYGSSVPLLVPLPGGGATAWSAVQAGLSHTLALANNGNLYSWGRNDAGELGTGHELVTTSNVEVPKPAGVTRWRAIAAGEEHSVALGDNGQLYGWGDNFYGELGNGNQISRPAPTPVLLPEGVTHWTEVWAGGASTFARGNNGRVYACGRNSGGELGIGTVNSGSPSGVSSPTAVLLPAGVTGWRTISVGRYHTVALDEQGQLFGWGSNEMGGLGYGITGIQSTPLALAAPAGVASWRTLSSGQSHNLAISGDGRLFAWGRGAGNSATTPALLISSRTNWNAIAAGVEHALAVASDCGLYAWGWNYYGALGSDRPSGNSLSTPELVSGLPDLCDTPPGTRELHVVGVHAGAGSTTTYQRGDAAVWVNRPGKRIVLFLSSYSPVRWYINVSAGTILERVILGGYYRQTVEGVGPETEVIPAWFTSGGIYTFIGSSLEDAEFYDARPRLCAMTGLDISSFHGSYVAPYPNSFIIDRVEDDERLRCDYPQPTPASELPPLNFRIAFHDQSPTGNVVFQNYTLAGPQDGERLLPAMRVVPDAAGRFYYGTENHQVWKADSQAGTAQQMILPATVPELSWPTGLAFDSQRNRVLLVSLGGEGYLYAYSPPSNQWSLVRSMANRDLESLEYHPAADVLYSLAVNGNGGRSLIYRLSPDGAVVGEIPLPFIPVRFGPGLYRTELVSVGEYLVLLMEPTYPYPSDTSVQEARIYLIDPRSGQSWLTYRRAYLPETRRPAVQVVWPAEGMAFPAGTTIPLRADASDPDGIVDTVEFFANGAALGRGRRSPDSSATFQLDWPNPLPGSYAVAARATDAVGLSTVSSAVHTSIRQGEPPLPVSERELHAVGISGGVDADGTPLGGLGQGHAAVAVNRPGKGVTLFLSSYNPVLWHVASSNGTVIEKVILGGYYAQAITGLSSNVPVERAYYYDDHDGDYLDIGWTMESGDFYRTVQRLCQRTGLDLASFHGAANPPYPAPFVIDSVQNDARLRCDYPRPVDPVYLPNLSFRLAWNDRSGTIVFKDYALAGPQSGSRLFQSYRVVTDAGGRYYYGAEQHQVWRVDSQTSTVQEMILPSNLPELSWPMGIAFDSLRNRVLAVTLGGEGFLYSYSPAQDQWSLVGSMDNRDVDCLVYHAADDSLYAVTQAYEGASSLLRFNAAGEFQSEIRLPVQPFRVGHGESRSELASVGDYLVLLLETDPSYAYFYPGVQAESRMYLIDPRTSQVSLTYRRILFPDQDDDGVPDDRDRCPNTAAGAVVDANGCSAAQRDTDRDGVPDSIDECPDTPLTARVDSRGCPLPDRCPRLIQWQAGFGTAQQDNPKHIYATADGGYVLGGGTYSNTNAHDFWVVRVDANGNKLWEKRIGGIYGEHFGDLKPLSDGGFIVGGARNRDDNYEFLLVRLDGNGNVLWERTYGGTRLDFITSLDVTADGGFILGGQSDSPADARKSAPLHGRYDYWLVRVDANGNKLWDRSFGGTEAEWLTKVISLADGGFLALGSSDSGANGNKTSANFGQNDAWVVRLDAQGNKIWERAIGGSGTEWLSSGLVLANGFLVVGQSGSPPSGNKTSPHFGGGDAWAVRLDVNGSVLWDGSYGGFGSDGASAVAALEDGGFVLGASSSSVASGNKSWPLLTSQDVWIVGIGASGEKLWDRAFGGGSPAASWLADLIQTADEGFLIASESYAGIGGDKTVPNFGGADAWLFKLPPLDRDCDADGVEDMLDFCPDTPAGSTVDARGCSASQRDSDGDGVTDDRDQCPGTPPEVQQVDANGCSISYPICAPPIQWQETYARDEFQHAQAARQLPDGGYLVLGSVQGINGIGTNAGFGNTDAYVLRIDANGQKLWDRIFGGSSEDSLSAMALLPDGGAVLAGYSASPADGNKTSPRIDGADGWLVRIDANGNKIWDKTFSAGEESFFRDIQRLPDGGFVLAGSANDSDDVGWVVRLNGNGEQLWERQIYHEENSWFNRVLVLPNGDLLAGGANEDDDGEFSFWLARLNPGGEILWERFYGGSGDEELTALLAVDGGFLLGGRSASPADGSKTSPNFGSVDYWIVGVDSGGNQLWDASFGGNGEDYLTDAVAMPNGDFVLGGWSSFSSGGNKRSPVLGQSDYWIVRVDASGQKIWDAAYGGDQGDELLDLELTSGGGLLLSGSSASNLSGNKTAPRRGLGDAWLVKLDSRNGCDLDGDGVPNDRDQCPNTLPGTPVDSRGCAVPPPPPPHCPFAVQWETALRHAGVEQLARVHQTADGGFIVGGTSYGSPAGYWVVRLNAQGSTLWERFFGSGSGSEVLFDLQPTSDGGFVLGGASSSPPFAGKTSPHYGDYDFWLVRIDANGNKLWDRSFGGSGFDGIYGLQQTADGGYILGGVSGSPADGNKTSPHFGSRDFWLVRTDANGNKLWDRSYGGSGTEFWARARQTADGGFVMVGTTDSGADGNKTTPHFGADDIWVVRLDSAGNKLWDQTYGGTLYEYPGEILPTADGGFIVSAWSQSGADGNKTSQSFGESDGWVLRLNGDGSRQWEQAFGGTNSDTLYGLARTSDGGYILGGYSQSGATGNKTSDTGGTWLVRLDANGNKLWDQAVAGGALAEVKQTSDGGFVIAGDGFSNETLVDGWVAKVGPERENCDGDGDGVPDDRDQCPNTRAGTVVNAQGCSIAQLCPCDGPWRNHSEYVQCVMDHAWEFYREGLIDENERKAITRAAVRSNCGRHHDREAVRIHLCPQTRQECQRDGIRVVLSGDVAGDQMIESSTDLINWSPVEAGTATVTGDEILFPVAPDVAARFYRIRIQ